MKKLILFLVLAFIFISCGEGTSKDMKNVKILRVGILLPIDRVQEDKALNIFQILTKIQGNLNNTDSLELKVSYVKNNPIKSFVELNKTQDLVAIISFLDSTQTLALKKEIEKSKIPVISTISTHSKITDIKYVSRICLNNKTQAHVAAAYIRDELFIPKVYVLSDRHNAFSVELSSFFTKRYEKLGGIVENHFDIDKLLSNPHTFVNTVYNEDVDTVYLSLDARKTKKLLSLFEQEGIKLKILAHDGLLSEFKSQFPDDIEKLNGLFVVDNYADDLRLSPKAQEFKKKVQAKGYALDSYDLLSFDAWSLLRQALNACENKKGECIHHYIRQNEGFEGAIDTIVMEEASAYRAVYVNEIKNSKMKIKVKVY